MLLTVKLYKQFYYTETFPPVSTLSVIIDNNRITSHDCILQYNNVLLASVLHLTQRRWDWCLFSDEKHYWILICTFYQGCFLADLTIKSGGNVHDCSLGTFLEKKTGRMCRNSFSLSLCANRTWSTFPNSWYVYNSQCFEAFQQAHTWVSKAFHKHLKCKGNSNRDFEA